MPPVHVRSRRPVGFSLVELLVVIVITGIIASTLGLFIGGPIRGYLDQARRGELVDAAQLALLRMSRDLGAALPNSIRVSGGAIELLHTVDGDRYRAEAPGTADDRLEFTAGGDTSFNTLRPLDASLATGPLRLAVYPLGPGSGSNPYIDASLTPAGTTVTVGVATSVVAGTTEYRVTLGAPHRFPFNSPSQRVYLVDGPVTYLCAGGELRRHSGYAVTGTQAVPPAGGTVAVVVKNVDSCSFSFAAGTQSRNAVATLAITLEAESEEVRLRRQVQVDNSP